MKTFFKSQSAPTANDHNAASAECTWAFYMVKHQQSFLSNDCMYNLFKAMFSDSSIAKKFLSARTKAAPNRLRHMLVDSVLQTLRCLTHVPTITGLQDRIHQHVPKSIQNRTSQERKQPERPGKLVTSIPHCDSAIGNHLLHNQKCASHYKDNQFFILSKAQSDFYLSVLESIFITL